MGAQAGVGDVDAIHSRLCRVWSMYTQLREVGILLECGVYLDYRDLPSLNGAIVQRLANSALV